MGSAVELVAFVTRAENRVETLLALAAGPQTRAAVQAETGIPRATLSRILADFRDRELVVRLGHDYQLTPLGSLLATELESLFATIGGMGTLESVPQWLPVEELDIPVEHFRDADVIVPEPTDPMAPIRRAETLLANGSRVRLLAHAVIPSCLDVVLSAVTEGRQTLEWVTTESAVETVREDDVLAAKATELLAADSVTGYVHPDDDLPLVFVIDDVVFLAVTDEAGTIHGHIETRNPAVHAWADALIDEYIEAADASSPEVPTE